MSASKDSSVSSTSDIASYRRIVERAATDEKTFAYFRSHPDYTRILEHVSPLLGKSYAEELQNYPPRNHLKFEARQFSVIGNPKTYQIEGFGKISPTYLRYLKVGCELQRLFGPLHDLTVSEIGIGFGGQTYLLRNGWGVRDFHLYDLEEVNRLAAKWLRRAETDMDAIRFHDSLKPLEFVDSDLAVSNYAFSELAKEYQDMYLDKVLTGSPRGYISWNSLSQDGYTVDELLQKLPVGAKAFEEVPETAPENRIITWGM